MLSNGYKSLFHEVVAARGGAEYGGTRLYIGYISASPTACVLRGYGRAGTQNDRLGEAVTLSTDTSIPAQ